MSKWREYKIHEIGDVVGGGTPSSKQKTYWGGKIGWLTPDDLSGYKFRHIGKGSRNITELGLKKSSAKLHPKNTVLMTSRAPIGYLAIAEKPLSTNQGFQSIRCYEDKADFNFVYYLLKAYKEGIALIGNGATFREVSGGKLKQYKVSIPSITSQKKIAKILSTFENLLENNLKQIKLLEEKIKFTYEEWFLRFKINGSHLNINKITKLPFDWETVKVKSLLKKIKNTVKIKSSNILDTGKNPVVDQSKKFISGYTNETNIHIYKGEPFIVFGDHTRILKFINFTFARGADGTQVIVSNNSRMPQTLFYHSLKALDLSNYHYARHFKFLKEEKIIIPEQKIAKKYNDMCVVVFEQIKNLRNQNNLLKEAVDLLLPRLMTGIIDTDDMDIAI